MVLQIILLTTILLIQESENKQFLFHPPHGQVLHPSVRPVPDLGIIALKENYMPYGELSQEDPDGPRQNVKEELGGQITAAAVADNEYDIEINDDMTYVDMKNEPGKSTGAKGWDLDAGIDGILRLVDEKDKFSPGVIQTFPPASNVNSLEPNDLDVSTVKLKDKEHQIKDRDENEQYYNYQDENTGAHTYKSLSIISNNSGIDTVSTMFTSSSSSSSSDVFTADISNTPVPMSIPWSSPGYISGPKLKRTLGPSGYVSYSFVPLVSRKRGRYRKYYNHKRFYDN